MRFIPNLELLFSAQIIVELAPSLLTARTVNLHLSELVECLACAHFFCSYLLEQTLDTVLDGNGSLGPAEVLGAGVSHVGLDHTDEQFVRLEL